MNSNFNKHLQESLDSHQISHIQDRLDVFIAKKEEVKNAIETKYGNMLASAPINSGSHAKKDGINVSFDLDVCVPFKRNSFATLEEMKHDVCNFLLYEYKPSDSDLRNVRNQKVSIGLDFKIGVDDLKMDIVPGRELNVGEYTNTYDINLFRESNQQKSHIKTNIKKHIDLVKGKSPERQIIMLLKIWKHYRNKDISSFFLELLVMESFDTNGFNIPNGLGKKLKMVVEFIVQNILSIRLADPANSNNIVSDTLTNGEKSNLQEEFQSLLRAIENNQSQLKQYFPVIDDFSESANDGLKGMTANSRPWAGI